MAHTNKNSDLNGKPVYGGVSDIKDDFDCSYIIAPVPGAGSLKVVEFVNNKGRNTNLKMHVAYQYCIEQGISYNEILASIQPVEADILEPIKQAEAIKPDVEVINAVSACINDGVNTKMKLVDATAGRTGISKKAAARIIEKYTGDDPAKHKWSVAIRARGAQTFTLLEAVPPVQSSQTAAA